MIFFFLSSGIFLGWSLGANDAANVFGTAVGSRMISFRKAAVICGVFVIIGAVLQGHGANETLGELGSITSLGGGFTAALSAGLAVFLMTRSNLPVSTSQAIVGAIIGWNFFAKLSTDYSTLGKIIGSWVSSPVLGAVFAILFYLLFKWAVRNTRIHILKLDGYIRAALLLAGAFGSYSLGANNIANVMGVFTNAIDLQPLNLGLISLGSSQQLFLLGGIAIAMGVFTYSERIMNTIGKGLMKMNSEVALVVVLSHSLVLFLFSSTSLQALLLGLGLPAIPLVPVSSSHTIIGAILGIGLLYGGRNINFRILLKIALGWVLTPLIAGMLCWLFLYVFTSVFQLAV